MVCLYCRIPDIVPTQIFGAQEVFPGTSEVYTKAHVVPYNGCMKPTTTVFTTDTVSKIAKLANIPVTEEEKKSLAAGFNETMKVVETLSEADTAGVAEVHQVTGLTNVLREDDVDETREFTQEDALMNAKRQHEGFFVVDAVLEPSQ